MTKYRGGYPALNWLAKQDPEAALAVLHHRLDTTGMPIRSGHPEAWLDPRETSPDDVDAFEPADHGEDDYNDNRKDVTESPVTFASMSARQTGRDEFQTEKLHEIKPTEAAILADLLRVRVTKRTDGRYISVNGMASKPLFVGYRAYLAGMEFNPKAPWKPERGNMIFYTDANGKKHTPTIRAMKPRGGKKPFRSNDSVNRYLALPSAVPSPLHAKSYRRPFSGEPALLPLLNPLPRKEDDMVDRNGRIDTVGRFGVLEGRALLKSFGVDGSVSFDLLPFSATKLPAAIAKGARFVAGITMMKETKSPAAPIGKFEPDVPDISDVGNIVLEEIHARSTLTAIGITLGYSKGYADRAGAKAVLASARELVAANENKKQNIAA